MIAPSNLETLSNTSNPKPLVDLLIALRKQHWFCTFHPISKFVYYNILSPGFHDFISNLDIIKIPKNIQEAWEISELREKVMEELWALENNETWDVIDLSREKKPIGCKWVFTVKYKANGTIECYKTCLVAKGFTQTYGIDYMEIFALVEKLNIVQVLLSLGKSRLDSSTTWHKKCIFQW